MLHRKQWSHSVAKATKVISTTGRCPCNLEFPNNNKKKNLEERDLFISEYTASILLPCFRCLQYWLMLLLLKMFWYHAVAKGPVFYEQVLEILLSTKTLLLRLERSDPKELLSPPHFLMVLFYECFFLHLLQDVFILSLRWLWVQVLFL